MSATNSTDPAVAAAVAQAVQEVSAQFGALLGITDLLWRFKAYLCAAIALLGWDILVTLPAEYRLFWRRNISVASFGFTFLRYWSLGTLAAYTIIFFTHYSPEACSRVHWVLPVMGLIAFSAAQFLIGLRVWAIWEKNRLVMLAFMVVYVTGVSLEIWAIQGNTYVHFPDGIPGCIDAASESSHHLWVFWVSPLLFDAVAIVLTLVKTWQHCRSGGATPLITIIARDGLLYFLCVFAMNLLNTIWFRSSRADHALHTSMSISLTTVFISRMYINLRSTTSKSSTNYSSNGSYPLSYRSADGSANPPLVNVGSLDRPVQEKNAVGKQEERGSFEFSV